MKKISLKLHFPMLCDFSDDAGYFFCTAHNRFGKAHAQVELVVVDRAQVRVDSVDVGAAPEDTMNISCSVEIDCGLGSECPEAFFKWTFDNRSLQSLPGMQFKTKFREHTRQSKQGRHLVQEVDLQVSASGKASRPQKIACYSLYGEDSVDVQPRPPMPAPLALKVEQDQEKVRLAWRKTNTHRDTRNHAVSGENEASGGYLVELRTKEDRQWRPAPREVVAESEPQSVTLSDLVPNTLYQFRVRSVDTSTLGDPSAPTTWVKTPPAPPSEGCGKSQMESAGQRYDSGRMGSRGNASFEYLLQFQAHQSGDHLRYRLSWSLDKEVEQDNSSQERKFLAHHIDTKTPQAIVRLNATEECRMLVFSVRPVNDQGVGATSTDTVAFVNSKGEPRRVSFTNATVLNSTHASFSWDWEKTNECGRAHAVQLTCTPPEDDPLTVTISGEFSEWTLGGLSADTKYECVLRPLNAEVQDDYGEYSSPVEIVTKHQPPSEAPSISKLSLRTTESEAGYTTIIEWSAIAFPQGNFTDAASGYKIFVYVSETASEAVVLTMPISRLSNPDRPSARLDGLRLMYMYTIQVAGYNSGGTGPLSAPRTIRLGPQSSIDDSSSTTADLRLGALLLLSLLLL
ncbi:fibronectin type III domain protein [Ostertagia ostertagi]